MSDSRLDVSNSSGSGGVVAAPTGFSFQAFQQELFNCH